MKCKVFLSYTSALSDTAERIELCLKGEGFAVFRDRSALPPGESFDARIRTAIEDSDLFVFLITPESVTPGRYTLTELKFAEQKWPHPGGRVLPVSVEVTPKDAIPAYLRSVTILKPRGNLVAEIAAEVARMGAPWWRRMLEPRRVVPAAVVALLLIGGVSLVLPSYLERREQSSEAAALVQQSRAAIERADYAGAWELLERANAVAPASRDVFEAQERLAMDLLRSAGVNYSRDTSFAQELVERTSPVLSRGTSGANGERLANLLAHLGWADYLRGGSAGSGGLDPAQRYRDALAADPGNVYAHAMWGFELLRARAASAEMLAEAKQHFAAALRSEREREYVRHLEVSAWLQTYTNVWIEDTGRQREAIRVANEMRLGAEARPQGWARGTLKAKLWPIYHFGFVTADEQAPLLAALAPAEHLALFRWLFPDDDLEPNEGAPSLFDYAVVRAQIEEHGGDRAGALAWYRRLLSEFAAKGYDAGRAVKIAEDAREAVGRLGG